jgi:choline monooxygenase
MTAFRPDPDLAAAHTPPGSFYDAASYARQQQSLFPRCWHLAPLARDAARPGRLEPWTMLPGCLEEPLLFATDDAGTTRCFANVCTHRGKLLVETAIEGNAIRCGYHGRCFGLDGALRSAPGFDGARGFPSPQDDLRPVPCGQWAGFRAASIDPAVPFSTWIEPARELLSFLDDELPREPTRTREYEVAAHWALYVDNYLEGFHIPYVHAALAQALAVPLYRYEVLPWGALQLGIANSGEAAIELPRGHRLAGDRLAGIWLWLFPGTMFNVYPWGLSLNVIEPLGPERTRVRHLHWIARPELTGGGAGADLDTVEREDQGVVAATQRGLRSRFYRGGRYAPRHEALVHAFHSRLADATSSS